MESASQRPWGIGVVGLEGEAEEHRELLKKMHCTEIHTEQEMFLRTSR